MHERTQRALARLMFVICCAVPTLITMVVLFISWTPWYHQACLREISESIAKDTGFLIEVDDFDRPSPSRLDLQALRVIDPETHREVARVDHLSWTEVNDGVSIVLDHPQLQSAELAGAWRLIHDRFLCSSICLSTSVRFAASDLTIDGDVGSTRLQDVDAWIEPGDDSTRATIECMRSTQQDGSGRDGSGFRIEVVRDRTGDMPVTTWTMETSDTPLPCSVFSQYYLPLARFGPAASFAGTARWSIDADGWWVDLSGSRFTNVDLERLTQGLPHAMAGTADIKLQTGMLRPAKAIDVTGEIRSERGFVATSLLSSLHRDFGMTVNANLSNPRSIAYDYFALHFKLFDSSVTLDGICATKDGLRGLPAGVVFYSGGESIVQAKEIEMASVELAKLLASPNSVLVPITPQTSAIMHLLLPSSQTSRLR
ncbi:hypothetical protein CA13_46180 [Planctomycetes bacterium CA13]|uniref:AsmA-like C-terminal domain-containing protein n=1 Tax=Novipirellula herctigrandis TaxID=2527986 RepID=A0A5C5Z7E9_9BACT|nr:hypothetical protein CA13_46180 [Planctomycetes bacterium CA13]